MEKESLLYQLRYMLTKNYYDTQDMKQDLLDLFLRANEKEIPQKPAIENFPKVKAIKFVRELLYKRNSTNEPFMRVTDIEGKLKAEMSLLSAKEFTEQFMDFIEQFITVKYSN